MDQDEQLRLQAHLDGELSAGESARLADVLKGDAEARRLFSELQQIKALLRENEPEAVLPVTPDFYWSRIQRAISRTPALSGANPSETGGWLGVLRRLIVPAAAVAALALLAIFPARQPGASVQPEWSQLAEVETTVEEMGAMTFRSYSDNMTFVWFYDRHDSITDSDLAGEM